MSSPHHTSRRGRPRRSLASLAGVVLAVTAVSFLGAPTATAQSGDANGFGAYTDVKQGGVLVTSVSAATPQQVVVEGHNFTRHSETHPGLYVLFGVVNWWRSAGPGLDPRPWAEYIAGQDDQAFISYQGSFTAPAANGLFDDTSTSTPTGDFLYNGSAGNDVPGIINKTITVASKFISNNNEEIDCTAEGVQCGIITTGAHGQISAKMETFTPLDFTGAAPDDPLDLTPIAATSASVDGPDDIEEGDTATVTGVLSPPDANWGQGAYVNFGWLETVWEPSLQAPVTSRQAAHTVWVYPGAPSTGATEPVNPTTGAFTITGFPFDAVGAHGSGNGDVWDPLGPTDGYAIWVTPAHGTYPNQTAWEIAVGVDLLAP